VSGLERSNRNKGEPDHAASPLQQEHDTLRGRVRIGGLERSDRN